MAVEAPGSAPVRGLLPQKPSPIQPQPVLDDDVRRVDETLVAGLQPVVQVTLVGAGLRVGLVETVGGPDRVRAIRDVVGSEEYGGVGIAVERGHQAIRDCLGHP